MEKYWAIIGDAKTRLHPTTRWSRKLMKWWWKALLTTKYFFGTIIVPKALSRHYRYCSQLFQECMVPHDYDFRDSIERKKLKSSIYKTTLRSEHNKLVCVDEAKMLDKTLSAMVYGHVGGIPPAFSCISLLLKTIKFINYFTCKYLNLPLNNSQSTRINVFKW